MKILISGGAKCGKSALAQEIAVALSEKRYYVATLISSGAEDDARIRHHLADRDGMGFETVECFRNLLDCLKIADRTGAFLVDSVTTLMQTALFPVEKSYALDLEGAKRCAEELVAFASQVDHVIYDSDYIHSDGNRYSQTTEQYRRCLANADRALAAVCDAVVEVTAGQYVIHKGELQL